MTDLSDILINLNKVFPNLRLMVTAMCFVTGLGFAMRAIYAFKVYGEMRTMMHSQTSLRGPLFYLFIAVCLMYTPSAFNFLMQTMYGYTTPEPLSYLPAQSESTKQAMMAALRLVQFIGIVAFFRGFFQLSKHAHQGGGGQHGIGKPLMHILGGIMAVNIVGTYNIFANTLALPSLQSVLS